MDETSANNGRLAGKVAIVTGGAAGIGEGICLEFASEDATIVVADVNLEGAESVAGSIRELGGKAMAVEVDVSDQEKVKEAVRLAMQKFGTIDILVNNAGWCTLAPPEQYTLDEWHRTVAINLSGPWFFCQAVIPDMMKRHRGKIVNIGSGGGILGAPRNAPYHAAKHGLSGLTRALACDLGPYNIHVNCICPGSVETPLLARSMTPENRERIISQYLLARLGKPSDIAKAAVFLASSDSD